METVPCFDKDLEFGKQYQLKVKDLFEWEEFVNTEGYLKEFDITGSFKTEEGNLIKTKWEVKADRRAKQTGNIAIEFESNGKPSGITTTTADFWIYFIHGENTYYLIPTSVLRRKVKQNRWWRIIQVNDEMRNRVYLFERSQFEKYRHEY